MTYTHVAVFIHWVTALIIIGLVAVGKFMTGLDETDALRFTLTQTHKTFGILVLLLSIVRVMWRLSHRAPPHPEQAPAWEKLAASCSHLAFYVLILLLPLSGWAMVSVSTLNIDTLLFNRIEWPHLPLVEWLNLNSPAAQKEWEHNFHHTHHLASNILLVLLLVHIAAAMKHHVIDKDDVLSRMKPRVKEPGFWGVFALVALVVGTSAFALSRSNSSDTNSLIAGSSSVTLLADVTGDDTRFEFSDTVVSANIDLEKPAQSALEVTVPTATVTGNNLQAVGSLPNADWFDVENYPTASFTSTQINIGQEPNNLTVTGDLTIKDTTQEVEFTMLISTDESTGESTAAVELPINRFRL